MLSLVTVAIALLALLIQAAPSLSTPRPPPPPDPATSAFIGEAGLIMAAVKPTATADYEAVIRALNAALHTDTDPVRKAATKGWRVFKAATPDAKGNALYIHVFLPAVPEYDYRPSLLVDTLVKELAPDLLSPYQDSFAGPLSKLDLKELANMALAPIPPEVFSPPVVPPGNATPASPPAIKKPGGR